MTFVMRLWTSRRGRTKSPCTVTVAKAWPIHRVQTSKKTKHVFRSSFNATKSSATVILMAYFVT